MRKSLVIFTILALASPLPAQEIRLAGRLDPPVLQSINAYLDSTRARGLPTEPLVQKALEGSAKGAPGDRILAAVRALGATLDSSRQALGPASTPDEIIAGSAALRAGATTGALRDLRRTRTTGTLDIPLAVLADLVGLGVGVDAAWQSVMELARTRASDREFIRLKERRMQRSRP